jgi:hypothetical protein
MLDWQDGPISWPLRSPDLTPVDFFMWGYVKDIVYANLVLDLQNLRNRITNAISTITPDMLQCVWIETDYRLDIVRATNCVHVEIV